MSFVHSLVRAEINNKSGWCAPVELGEAAPHYISFVIPVDENRKFFTRYTCETIVVVGVERRREAHDLLYHGQGAFVLRFDGNEFWFTVRPISKTKRHLPYVGSLEHPDFECLLAEIEPKEPAALDRFFEEKNTFVIGCDPFSHYAGIERPAHSHIH